MQTKKRGSGTTAWTICGLILYALLIPSASALGAVLGSFFDFYLGKEVGSRNPVVFSDLVPTSGCPCEWLASRESTRVSETETSLRRVNHPAEAHPCSVQGLVSRGQRACEQNRPSAHTVDRSILLFDVSHFDRNLFFRKTRPR